MSTFKQLIETYGKQIDLRISQAINRDRGYGAGFMTFSSEKVRSANLHFDGALFTSVMRCLDIVFEGDLRKLIDANYVQGSYWWGYPRMAKGDELSFRVTASANGESKYIDYGMFHIAEELEYDENADTTKVVAYDRMYEAMKPYDISSQNLTFPTTLKEYTKAVCKACFGNTSIIEGIDNIRNGSKTVTSDLYAAVSNDSGSSYTFRDVLDEIARCAGCSFAFKSNANGNYTNRLYLIYVTDGSGNMIVTKDENNNPYVLDIDNFKSLTIGEQYGTINSVIYSRQPQNDNVMKSATGVRNPVAVKLKQPEIADSDSDATRLTWLADVLAAVNGLNYRCYELESYGIGYLNFGDTFTIKTYEQVDREFDFNTPVTYQTIFMRCDMDFAGGDIKDKSKLEMPVATAADVEDSATAETATEKMLRQAFMRVDKEIGQIKALLTDPDESLRAELTATAAAIRLEMENGLEGLENEIETTASGINARIASEVDDLETLISTTASGLSASFTNSINGLQSQISANASSISAALTAVSTVQGQIEGVTDDIDDLIERIDNIDVTDDIAAAVQTEIQKSTTISAIAGQVNSQISGTYVTKASLPTELSSYAKKSEIPTDYLTDADLPDLSGYALKSELPTMTNYVLKTEYNSYISQTDSRIASAVNRVASLEGAGYITNADAQTLVEQSATSITATVKGSIKIGGVNLLRDSECFGSRDVSYPNSTVSSGYPKIETAEGTPSGAAKHFYFTCSTSGAIGVEFTQTASNNLLIPDYSQIEADKPYTFSFWAKGGSSTNGRKISLESLLYFGDGITVTYEGEPSISLYSSWRKYSVTFSLSGTPTAFRIAFKHSGTASTNYTTYISSLQLESGNVVTDWAPCVKDIEDSTDAKLAMYVRVEDGKLVSAIDIEANKISISSNNFTLTRTGEITATSGTIGGWEITNTYFAKAITADGVTTYTSLKTTTPAAMGFGSSSPTDFSDANFRILHNGEAWSGKDTDNQIRLKSGHIDFYYAGLFTARIGQTTNNTISFEKPAGTVGIELNPANSCIYMSKTNGYLCIGSSSSATTLIGMSSTNRNLIIGATTNLGDAYYNVPSGKKHIFNTAAQFNGNVGVDGTLYANGNVNTSRSSTVTIGGTLLVNNHDVGASLESLDSGLQTCVSYLNKTLNYVAETTHQFKNTTYDVVRFGNNNTSPHRYTYISGYNKVFVGPGTNFEDNVAVYGRLYLSASPSISLSSASESEYTTVTLNDEEIEQDVFDYFENTNVLLSPTTLITTAAHSSTLIVEDENGNPQEIVTEYPYSETTESPSVRFEDNESIPDILKSEDSDTVDLVSLACLEWKAIKELITRLRAAENKILQLEGA